MVRRRKGHSCGYGTLGERIQLFTKPMQGGDMGFMGDCERTVEGSRCFDIRKYVRWDHRFAQLDCASLCDRSGAL